MAFADVDADGKIDVLVPTCTCKQVYIPASECTCEDAILYLLPGGSPASRWQKLYLKRSPKLLGTSGGVGVPGAHDWVFPIERGSHYTDTITLRFGDYDIDGFPDFLATMYNRVTKDHRVFLFRNVPSPDGNEYSFPRGFEADFELLPYKDTVVGAFFDFRENGLPDVILLRSHVAYLAKNGTGQRAADGKNYELIMYENDRPVGYDHYFLKTVVFGPRRKSDDDDERIAHVEDPDSAATNVAGVITDMLQTDL